MTSDARRRFILFASAGYAILALAWIFLSDQILTVFPDTASILWLSTAKRVFFVAVTTALLYAGLRAVSPVGGAESVGRVAAAFDAATLMRRPNWLIFVFSVSAIIALVVSLVTVALWQDEDNNRERATVATKNIALLLDRDLTSRFDRINLALQSVVYYYQTLAAEKHFDPVRFDAYVQHKHQLIADVAALRVLDKDGFVRYGNDVPTGGAINNADRPYFFRARAYPAAGLIVDGPLISRIEKQAVIVLARRLNAPDGSFAGVVVGVVTTASIGELLSSLELGPHGAATIRTADLSLVQRFPEVRNRLASRVVSADLDASIKLHPDGGRYVATTRLDNIERSNFYRRLGKYPFYVIVGLASVDFESGWKRKTLLLSAIASLAILATVLAAGLVYHTYRRKVVSGHSEKEL